MCLSTRCASGSRAVASLDIAALEAEEIAVLGRKQGELTHQLKALAALSIDEKRARGAALNSLKLEFEAAFVARRAALAQAASAEAAGDVDLTMPGRRTLDRHAASGQRRDRRDRRDLPRARLRRRRSVPTSRTKSATSAR